MIVAFVRRAARQAADLQNGGSYQSNHDRSLTLMNPQHIVLSAANIEDIQKLHDRELNNQKLWYDKLRRVSSTTAQSGQTLQENHDKVLADYERLQTRYETMDRKLQLRNL